MNSPGWYPKGNESSGSSNVALLGALDAVHVQLRAAHDRNVTLESQLVGAKRERDALRRSLHMVHGSVHQLVARVHEIQHAALGVQEWMERSAMLNEACAYAYRRLVPNELQEAAASLDAAFADLRHRAVTVPCPAAPIAYESLPVRLANAVRRCVGSARVISEQCSTKPGSSTGASSEAHEPSAPERTSQRASAVHVGVQVSCGIGLETRLHEILHRPGAGSTSFGAALAPTSLDIPDVEILRQENALLLAQLQSLLRMSERHQVVARATSAAVPARATASKAVERHPAPATGGASYEVVNRRVPDRENAAYSPPVQLKPTVAPAPRQKSQSPPRRPLGQLQRRSAFTTNYPKEPPGLFATGTLARRSSERQRALSHVDEVATLAKGLRDLSASRRSLSPQSRAFVAY
jgi:hypothetical protein